jgi:hypothetical protein
VKDWAHGDTRHHPRDAVSEPTLDAKEEGNPMRCSLLFLPVAAIVTLSVMPVAAQTSPLYTRHPSPRFEREPPIPELPQPGTLTADQKRAIAPVLWPAAWPAPKVPAGIVLTVPPRPNWQPQPGEYWGPFTDDSGAWGFMVGPHSDSASAPTSTDPVPPIRYTRLGAASSRPVIAVSPIAPPAPALPVAGPVSPDGQMVVSYPDGKQVTWQLPVVAYKARVTSRGTDGTVRLTDAYGRQGVFTLRKNARISLNGQMTDVGRLPIGAAVNARALRIAPTELTVIDAVK